MMEMRPWIKTGDTIETLQNKLAAANARAELAERQLEETRNVRNALFISLEAVNARIAELEKQKPSYKAEFDCMYEKFKAEESLSEHYKQRAEQAEAKAKRLIKKLTYNTPSFRDGERDEELLTIDENELVPLKSCMCDRLKQVEAQAAAMRIGLEKIKSLVAEAAGKGDALCYEIYIWVCESGANNANNAGTAILADNKRMREALEVSRAAIDSILTHYGTNLEVINWHQNGNSEPLDNFFDENGLPDALDKAKAALHPAQHGAQFDESCFNPDVKVNP